MIDQISRAISQDPSLLPEEHNTIVSLLSDKARLQKILSSGTGALLGVAFAKYLKLSKTAQVLLAMAGYGIGRLFYNTVVKQDNRQFAAFNDKLKTYEVDPDKH